MPAQNNLRTAAREPRSENRRPIIAPVPGVDYLHAVRADKSGSVQNERQLERSSRRRMKWNPQILRDVRKFAPGRSRYPDRVPQFHQRMGDADGAIVGASAREHRVQMKDAQR